MTILLFSNDEQSVRRERSLRPTSDDTMLHQLNIFWLTMMFLVSARHLSDLTHDCLYYHVADHLRNAEGNALWQGLSHIIPYCIRLESIKHLASISSTILGTVHRFSELLRQQATVQQLYNWSRSADLAESYQLYRNS